MPELPEVETMRRGILPHVQGRGVARVDVRRPNCVFPCPKVFLPTLKGTVSLPSSVVVSIYVGTFLTIQPC